MPFDFTLRHCLIAFAAMLLCFPAYAQSNQEVDRTTWDTAILRAQSNRDACNDRIKQVYRSDPTYKTLMQCGSFCGRVYVGMTLPNAVPNSAHLAQAKQCDEVFAQLPPADGNEVAVAPRPASDPMPATPGAAVAGLRKLAIQFQGIASTTKKRGTKRTAEVNARNCNAYANTIEAQGFNDMSEEYWSQCTRHLKALKNTGGSGTGRARQ